MNIANIISYSISGSANGVRVQAESWAKGLSNAGHKVELVNPWGNYDWKKFDVIHVYGYGNWLDIVPALASRTDAKIVISPIIDTNRSFIFQKVASYLGINFLHMTSPLYSLRSIEKYISMYYVRSNHEKQYLLKSLDIPESKVTKIPLSCRFSDYPLGEKLPKENFCLHVSILSSSNKNVKGLIAAAIKYNFKLVLAGSVGTEEYGRELVEIVDNNENIDYLGFLSEGELVEVYSKAKVFALPSFFEGVGLVAIEAAALGADIVLTDRGAPKEYYHGKAFLVDPVDIDQIGLSVQSVLSGESNQPELSHLIRVNNHNETICDTLAKSYRELL